MRNNVLVFVAVTVVSLVAAMLGHRFCPAFCMLFKPITWPFICLVVLVVKSLREKRAPRDKED
jgi:hypothetical protein